jgi:hypothetical protein
MKFEDMGRMVLEVTITDRLGDFAVLYDIPALVDAYVERFGFKDIDEVPSDEFGVLASEYRLN